MPEAAHRAEAPRTCFTSRLRRSVTAGVVGLPDRVVLLFLWTSLVVSFTVLTGEFRPVVVLPTLVVVVAVTWRLAPGRVPATRGHLAAGLVALAGAAAWLVVNLPYAARYVLVTRDPGFLTLEGFWLSEHAEAQIPVGSALDAAAAVPGFSSDTGAYYPLDGVLHAQGAKLLPGLLGLGGWAAGDSGVLVANLAVGAVALLAVYGLARRVVGPWWALLPLATLAVSMPMTAFSRAAYTEPLTVALIFGGLTLSWSAFETRSWWRHTLAGVLIGATSLARIDGAATVIGFVAGLAVVGAASLLPRARRRTQAGLAGASVAALALVGLGYVDLRLHSPGYLADLGDQFSLLAGALAATVAVAVMITVPRWWDPLRRVVLRRRRGLGIAAAVAVLLVAVALVTRFLWLPAYHTVPDTGYSRLVAGLQDREQMLVEPTRSYDDWSVRWLSWYFGWPMVVLAFGGLALLARRAVARRDPRLMVLLAVVAAPSALYLWRVSISPDQIWAMRRLLPVTIPGFLVVGTYALRALWDLRRVWWRGLAGVLAAAVALFPLTTWSEMFRVPEQDGRLGELRTVCDALPTDKVVYVHAGGPPYLASLRSVCDVEVVQIERPPTTEELDAIREAWGGQDLAVVAFKPDALPWPAGEVPAPLLTTTTSTWDYALSHIPRTVTRGESSVWVATIGEGGTLTEVG